jgi:hypothetical protein
MKNKTGLVRVYPKDYDITAVIKDGNVVITAQEQYSAGIFQVDFD